MLFHAIIFVTGGAILALELLASRIMAPYFGVSLYIWTGILSITLIALALGYQVGGRVAARHSRKPGGSLVTLFLLMPAVASLSIVAACVAYPTLFPALAAYNLVGGSFIACLFLLFVPLVATSAMNPLLVAIELGRREAAGDAGSGHVFFVSTVGSVAGVLATAFLLVPNLSNFVSVLIVAVTLAALTLLALPVASLPPGAGTRLALAGGIALLASAGFLVKSESFVAQLWPVKYAGAEWRLEARESSLFGTVKVLRSTPDDTGAYSRVYFQDGLIQNRVDSENRSISFYTYALEALAAAFKPQARNALVLGLGAGMVPMRLAAQGLAVDAVDIDPASFRVAQRYFGFDPGRVRAVEEDARTFLGRCRKPYDIIVVDLFHGDGMPEYLVTREFFRDLRRCLGTDGVAVLNTFADLNTPRPYAHFLATLRAELPNVLVYRPDERDGHVNSFVVVSPSRLSEGAFVSLSFVPPMHRGDLAEMLRRPRPVEPMLEGGRIVTDARNAGALDAAAMQSIYRQTVVRYIPPAFLLN